MSTPKHSVKNGTRLHHTLPRSAPPTTTSFNITPQPHGREAQPPRGDGQTVALDRHATSTTVASPGRLQRSSQTSAQPEDNGSQWVWVTVGHAENCASVLSLSSVKSRGTASTHSTTRSDGDSGYVGSDHAHRESHATSAPSVYSQKSVPRSKNGLQRSNSTPTRSPTSTSRSENDVPVHGGRSSSRSSSQAARSSTGRSDPSNAPVSRPSHKRSSSDTTSTRIPNTHDGLDPNLQHRRSSDSRATRTQVPNHVVGRSSSERRDSLQSASSNSSSPSLWTDSSPNPSTANTSLFRLKTDVPTQKLQAQTNQVVSRLSKPLPDIPESPVSPPHPVSAGAPDARRPLGFTYPTKPSDVTWLPPKESLKDSKGSLHRDALSNGQLATSNSTKPLAVTSGNSSGHPYSVVGTPGSPGDLFAISGIAIALEDVCGVLLRRDVLSVMEVVVKFLRAVDDSVTTLLDGLPEYVRNVHTITIAVSAINSHKDIFMDHCRTLVPGASNSELDRLFRFAESLMRELCNDFSQLLLVCSKALYKYNADPEECADIGTFLGARNSVDQAAHDVEAQLAAALRNAWAKTNAGKRGDSLFNIIRSVVPRQLWKNTIPIQVASSPFGPGGSIRRHRSHSEPNIAKNSSDTVVDVLNLDLKSARQVFNSISRNYLSVPFTIPIQLNPRRVRYSTTRNGKDDYIVAITVEELVRFFTHYTDGPHADTITLMDAFFLFFRHYINALDLVDIMIKIFNEPMPRDFEIHPEEKRRWRASHASTKLGVVRLMAFWLEHYFVAVSDDVALEKINHFTFEVVTKDPDLPPRAAWLISMHLCNCKGGRREQAYPGFPSAFEKTLKDGERGRVEYKPTGFVHDVVDTLKKSDLVKLDIIFFGRQEGGLEEIARALTFLESEIIHETMPVSYFHHREEKPHQTIVAMKNWSNALGMWVRDCIQRLPTAHERAAVFDMFASIMQHCFDLRNYSSAYTILLELKAIQSSERLRLTVSRGSPQSNKIVNKIDAYFGDSRHNFPRYRKHMATTSAPANPLFSVIGSDLAKVAAMKKQVEAKYGLQDLSKRQSWIFPQYLMMVQGIVRDLERCYTLYGIPVNERIKQWVQVGVRSFIQSKYDDIVQGLDSIPHDDEKRHAAAYSQRKLNLNPTTH